MCDRIFLQNSYREVRGVMQEKKGKFSKKAKVQQDAKKAKKQKSINGYGHFLNVYWRYVYFLC